MLWNSYRNPKVEMAFFPPFTGVRIVATLNSDGRFKASPGVRCICWHTLCTTAKQLSFVYLSGLLPWQTTVITKISNGRKRCTDELAQAFSSVAQIFSTLRKSCYVGTQGCRGKVAANFNSTISVTVSVGKLSKEARLQGVETVVNRVNRSAP